MALGELDGAIDCLDSDDCRHTRLQDVTGPATA
jgi:hypothetical protein